MGEHMIRESSIPDPPRRVNPETSLGSEALARLRHAESHIGVLNRDIDELLQQARFRPWINHGHVVITADDQSDVPTERWGLLIGDVVVNLRAALDHMIWSLSVAQSGPPTYPLTSKWRRIQFPICLSEKIWATARSRQIWALGSDVKSTLRKFQPFTAALPRLHPLWILKELANLNKHRTLPILARRLSPGFLTVSPPPIRGRLLGGRHLAPFVGTQELARVALEARYAAKDSRAPSVGDTLTSVMCLKLDMNIVFGEGVPGSGRDVIGTLNQCGALVRSAIGELATTFAQPSLFS